MEEYIQLMADKARGHDQTFNCDDLDSFTDFETDFPAIVYNDASTSNQNISSEPTPSIYNAIKSNIEFYISFSDSEDEDYTFIYNKDSSSYKLIPGLHMAYPRVWDTAYCNLYNISDEECSTSGSEDEEYAMAVRDFKKFFKRRGLGFNSFEASSSGTKEIKFVKAQKNVTSYGGLKNMGGPQSAQAAPKANIRPPPATPGSEKSVSFQKSILGPRPKHIIVNKVKVPIASDNEVKQFYKPLSKPGVGFSKPNFRSKTPPPRRVNNNYPRAKTPQPKRNIGRQNQPHGFPICLGVDLEPDEWIKDSGCSKHMTGNRNLFSTCKAYNEGNVIFGSNLRGNIIGKGQICDNKCRVTFSKHDSEITKDGKVIGRGIRKKGLYVMKLGNKPKDKICLATIDENSTLWHRRLGHANMRLIQSLASKELVRNLPKRDRGTRRGRQSTSSSTFDQPSSSHLNDDDDDGNNEGASRASTPSPIHYVNSLTNQVPQVFQNPPNIDPHLEPFYTRQIEIINRQVQLRDEQCGGVSDEDVTTILSPTTTYLSPTPPNAPSKTTSTNQTSSSQENTSSSFHSKLQISPPSSNEPTSPHHLNHLLDNISDVPPRPLNPQPLQSHPSLDIRLSLSPITPLDHIHDTLSPPSPPQPQPHIMGHPLFYNYHEHHGSTCICCSHKQNFFFTLRDEMNIMFAHLEDLLTTSITSHFPPPP
ncbi:retrovirus-related pol polyprotein from transposon TNT 1-94 [Tanacetum coccineum]